MVALRRGPSGPALELAAGEENAGLQAAWAIDPALGDDDYPGTPTFPLRTMREFNNRLQGVAIDVTMTLQLVGNVIDDPLQIVGARFKPTTSLTVTGTRTQVGTGTVSTVTALGNGATTFPWRLVTTGIDWTTISTSALLVTSTGQSAFIRDVIDANTVEIGPLASSTFAPATPTAGATFTVFTLSRALPPSLYLAASSSGTAANIAVSMLDLSFDGGLGIDMSGGGIALQRCEFTLSAQTEWRNAAGNIALIRGCRMTCTGGGPTLRGRFSITVCLFLSASTIRLLSCISGAQTLGTLAFKRVRIAAQSAKVTVTTGGLQFDAVSGTIVAHIDLNGSIYCNTATSFVSGTNCTATSGIEVTFGAYLYLAAAVPTLGIASGCTADVKLGGGATILTFTYAQIATGKQFAFADAAPNTVTQINGGGFAFLGPIG